MNNKNTKTNSVRDLLQVIEKKTVTTPQNEEKNTPQKKKETAPLSLSQNNNTTNNSNIKKRTNILNTATLPPTPVLLIIDNFYNNPIQTRNFILQQDFRIRGNYPGPRTVSFATSEIRDMIQKYVLPFGGKITKFPLEKSDNNYNGAFQYTTSRDRSWMHCDSWNNWAAILFLTPDAPINAGTGLYMFEDGTRFEQEQKIRNNKDYISKHTQDVTKWTCVDKVGNIFNRLVIFNANHFHQSMDYFGHSKETGRLFQVFFFSTEKQRC